MEKPLSQQIIDLIKSEVKEPDKIFTQREAAEFMNYLAYFDNVPKQEDSEPPKAPTVYSRKLHMILTGKSKYDDILYNPYQEGQFIKMTIFAKIKSTFKQYRIVFDTYEKEISISEVSYKNKEDIMFGRETEVVVDSKFIEQHKLDILKFCQEFIRGKFRDSIEYEHKMHFKDVDKLESFKENN